MSFDSNTQSCDLNLINCKIVMGSEIVDGGISILDSKIAKISKSNNLLKADTTIDIKNKLVLPGLIDVHVHCRDMCLAYKEDYFTATAAALHGGITTILDMPNTKPPTISTEKLNQKIETARKKIVCNVGFYSGVPKNLDELQALSKMGIFGVKLLLNNPMTDYEYNNAEIFINIIKRCAENQLSVLIHPEFKYLVEEKLKIHENDDEISKFLKIHDETNEFRTIEFILDICKDIDCHIHFCHLSTAMDIQLISDFKAQNHNLKITSEVTPHHMFLTEKDLYKWGSYAKMLPPLRTHKDCIKLIEALKSGIIEVIGTDHAPHSLDEKNLSFSRAPSGIPNLETVLPLLLIKVNQGIFSIFDVCKFFSEYPAKLFKIKNKGQIAKNYDADLVVIDPKIEFEIDPNKFYSKAKYSPFKNFKCKGKPIMTFINGKLAMTNDEICFDKGNGKIILKKY